MIIFKDMRYFLLYFIIHDNVNWILLAVFQIKVLKPSGKSHILTTISSGSNEEKVFSVIMVFDIVGNLVVAL